MIENTILFINNDNTEESVTYLTRSDFNTNPFLQNKLRSFHGHTNMIQCMCTTRDIYMNVRKRGEKYFLASNPGYIHDEDCPFNIARDSMYDEDNNLFSSSIFDEAAASSSNGMAQSVNEKEKARRYTFKHFAKDLLGESYSYAFNDINKEKTKNDFKMPSFQTFSNKLSLLAYKKEIVKKRGKPSTLAETLKQKKCKYVLGFVEDNISEGLDNQYNNLLKITLTVFKNDFRKNYIYVKRDKLENALKTCLIYENKINAPYLVFAIVNEDYEAIRIYLLPIYIESNTFTFCFIDSGRERRYANILYNNNSVFLKPFTNQEFANIKKEKILGDSTYTKKPFFKARPDFIVFENEEIHIIEVLGFEENPTYMRQLEIKRREYRKLCSIYSFLKYKEVSYENNELIERIIYE